MNMLFTHSMTLGLSPAMTVGISLTLFVLLPIGALLLRDWFVRRRYRKIASELGMQYSKRPTDDFDDMMGYSEIVQFGESAKIRHILTAQEGGTPVFVFDGIAKTATFRSKETQVIRSFVAIYIPNGDLPTCVISPKPEHRFALKQIKSKKFSPDTRLLDEVFSLCFRVYGSQDTLEYLTNDRREHLYTLLNWPFQIEFDDDRIIFTRLKKTKPKAKHIQAFIDDAFACITPLT